MRDGSLILTHTNVRRLSTFLGMKLSSNCNKMPLMLLGCNVCSLVVLAFCYDSFLKHSVVNHSVVYYMNFSEREKCSRNCLMFYYHYFYFQAINLHMVCKASSGVVQVPSFDENDKL